MLFAQDWLLQGGGWWGGAGGRRTVGTIVVCGRLGSAAAAKLSKRTGRMAADPEFVTIFLEAP